MGSRGASGAKIPEVYGELGPGGLPVGAGEAEWVPGPSQTPWLLARALASGPGWAGRSRQSHETQLLPTWPGGLYLQDPRRQRALPGLLFMATDGSTAPNRLLA